MCLSEPGTRQRYAIGVYAPRVKHSLAEGHFFFPVSVGGAGRAVGGVARHGNILAFLVAVCGLPTICLHAAAYLLSPFAPFRLLRKRACGWGVGTSRLRLVVTFYFRWRGCRSCLVFVA